MEGIVLKVSVNALKAKSQEITNQINRIESSWKEIDRLLKGSKGYWEGDASDKHQKYRNEVERDVRDVIKRLKEHPKDLLKMAGVYEEAEEKAKELASALPDDVII